MPVAHRGFRKDIYMKFLDLLRMSSGNLWKRKVRTILTVLGVVIGVASIVVMISLGLGLSQSLVEEYKSYGSLTQVTVNQPWDRGSDDADALRLDDALIKYLESMENVTSVYPVLETSVLAKYGRYSGYLQVQGMPKEAFEDMNIQVGEGHLPGEDNELAFFFGCEVLQNFYDEKGGGGYWETGILPDIDLMNDSVFYIFDMDAYYQSQGISDDGTVIPAPKKYLVKTAGVEQNPGENQYSMYGWYTYCDIDQLKNQLKKVFKNKPIPGQPTMKSGKPYKELFYNQLLVNVDSMEHVIEVQNRIKDLGYEAYSNAEWLESEQKTMGYIQAVLGGIGAVSLLVAAIGITNTMMMSIYERTKEIGVMKVLGCDLRNIRSLFLMEAGFIGFIGGVIGLILSFTISIVINKIVASISEYMQGISYIPFWLVILSLLFAVLVGMVAGFFPARRAMKLSPLAAIRNE